MKILRKAIPGEIKILQGTLRTGMDELRISVFEKHFAIEWGDITPKSRVAYLWSFDEPFIGSRYYVNING